MNQGIQFDLDRVMSLATDPDLGLFDSRASFNEPSGAFSVGAPTGAYVPVAGLQSIPCIKAAQSMLRVGGTEMKSLPEIETIQPWHTLLDAYYPALDGHTEYQCTVTDPGNIMTTYDVLAVEKDSQSLMTRLTLRLVTL